MEKGKIRVRNPKTVILSVRISKHTLARLKKAARKRGVKLRTLARHFILEGLKRKCTTVV